MNILFDIMQKYILRPYTSMLIVGKTRIFAIVHYMNDYPILLSNEGCSDEDI